MNNKYWGQYKNEGGVWKSIKCSTYKKLKETYPTKWEGIKIFTRKIRGERFELHSKSNSNKFAFNPRQSSQDIKGGKMTITHEFISEVIASLEILNIKLGKETIQIRPDKVLLEEKNIIVYCTEQKKYIPYYPDIYIYFSSNEEHFKKWGGRFAIEINFTNSPSNTKRKHFQYLGIPLLELKVFDSIKFRGESTNVGDYKLDTYHSFLQDIFSKEIRLEQKYVTYSNKYLGNLLYESKQEKEILKKEILNYEQKISSISYENNLAEGRSNADRLQLEFKLSSLNSKNADMKTEINNFRQMGFFRRLMLLFKV